MKLQQDPIVHPDRAKQLEFEIADVVKTLTAPEALAHVIKLYGAEFEKANAALHRQRDLLARIRACLHKWRGRYAASDHARQHVEETNLLIQEIDSL